MSAKPYPRTREIMACVHDAINATSSARSFALLDAARAAIEQLEDLANPPLKSWHGPRVEGVGDRLVVTMPNGDSACFDACGGIGLSIIHKLHKPRDGRWRHDLDCAQRQGNKCTCGFERTLQGDPNG